MDARISHIQAIAGSKARLSPKSLFALIEDIDFLLQEPSITHENRSILKGLKKSLVEKNDSTNESTVDLTEKSHPDFSHNFGIFEDVERNPVKGGTKEKKAGEIVAEWGFGERVRAKYWRRVRWLGVLALALLCALALWVFLK